MWGWVGCGALHPDVTVKLEWLKHVKSKQEISGLSLLEVSACSMTYPWPNSLDNAKWWRFNLCVQRRDSHPRQSKNRRKWCPVCAEVSSDSSLESSPFNTMTSKWTFFFQRATICFADPWSVRQETLRQKTVFCFLAFKPCALSTADLVLREGLCRSPTNTLLHPPTFRSQTLPANPPVLLGTCYCFTAELKESV